ncbi:MAG: hypothetical protein ACYC5N_07810 [Endomicrobiales bacterium]
MNNAAEVDRLSKIMERAGAAGYNGIVLANLGGQYNGSLSQGYRDTIAELSRKAASLGLVLIPGHFSQDDPGASLRDPDLVQEAFPVRGTAFLVSAGSASVRAEPAVAYLNGGFENWDPTRVQEAGVCNTIRRPCTPVTVSSPDGGRLYRENVDYTLQPGYLAVPPGSALLPGMTVKVDWFQEAKENVRQGYFVWAPCGMSSGIYFVRLKGPGMDASGKIAVFR